MINLSYNNRGIEIDILVKSIAGGSVGAVVGTAAGLFAGGAVGVIGGGAAAYFAGESINVPQAAQTTLEVIMALPLVPTGAAVGAAAGATLGLFVGGTLGMLYGAYKSIAQR